MKKLTILTLALVVLFAACGRTEQKQAEPVKQTPPTEPMKKEEPQSNKLEKWPTDYPITGDSVAVVTVEQQGIGALGTMVIEFYPDKAPNHVRNFKWLADHGFYNGTKFHRVIKGFMIQGGDPQGTGMGGPGWNVNAEFNDTPHTKGVLSMARSSDPNSAGSQFFICHGDPKHLNGQYTAFGKVIKGIEVVDKVADVAVGGPQNSTPVQTVTMTSVKIVSRAEAMGK